MREPWSFPIPQAMQQHGGIATAIAKGRVHPPEKRRTAAASPPREIKPKQAKTVRSKRKD